MASKSYGPEMRGGTANCSVMISDEPIGSPLLTSCDALIALNKPSLEKFARAVKPGGIVILDSSLMISAGSGGYEGVFAMPASTVAAEAGNMTFAGVMLLGCLSRNAACFSPVELSRKRFGKSLPERKHSLIPIEMDVFDRGGEYQ
jgi:2-oxoglutarate ferredoxin oxidoreductase subunit gamma